MTGLQLFDAVGPVLKSVVGNIGDDDLTRATPCAKLDVAGVLGHLTAGASAFAPLIRGEAQPGTAPTQGPLRELCETALGSLFDAAHSDGAEERIVATPFGDLPGATFFSYLAFDGLSHAWDLATATGQTISPDESVVAEIDAFARGFIKPEMRDGDTFADETTPPNNATPLERLVAFSGRSIPANGD